MKKCAFFLFLVLSAFLLLSCEKMFESVGEPEQKYLSVSNLCPDDALTYIGDIANCSESETYYIVQNCLGYSDLKIAAALVEYNSLYPFFTDYLEDIELNAKQQMEYPDTLTYDPAKQYVEILVYLRTDVSAFDESDIVAYELRVFYDDFTNPPEDYYAKKVLLSPDMQIDLLTNRLITTGAVVNYWGAAGTGHVTIQEPNLTGIEVFAFPSNDDNGGGNASYTELSMQDYPGVWTELGQLGTICNVFAELDDNGDLRVDDSWGYSKTQYYVEYSQLDSNVSAYFDTIPINSMFMYGSFMISDATNYWIEYVIEHDSDDFSILSYDIRLLADFSQFGSGNFYAKNIDIPVEEVVSVGNNLSAVFAARLQGGAFGNTRKLLTTEYPEVWSQMQALGNLKGIYTTFDDNDDILMAMYPGTDLSGRSFIAEYSDLNAAVVNYKIRYPYTCGKFIEHSYNYDADCSYVEFIEVPSGELTVLAAQIFDTEELMNGADLCAVDVIPCFGQVMNTTSETVSIYDYICNGGMKQLDESVYSDVSNQLSSLGSGFKLFALFGAYGERFADNLYYAKYINLNDNVSDSFEAHMGDHANGFPYEIEHSIFYPDDYYVTYEINEDESNWTVIIYSAEEYLGGNHDCGWSIHGNIDDDVLDTITST